MFTFITIMAFGVIIGYRLRHTHKIHKVTSLIQAVVCLLLFILGLSIGTNKLIVGNLSYFCRQAAVISALSLLGSSIAALLVSHLFSRKEWAMKSSLAILLFFLLGCVGGLYYTADFDLHLLSVDVLYVLMLLLGINLGCNQDLKGFVRQFSFKMLLVPLATVAGTFLFSAVAGFILSQWSVFDCMAVGSGFAYYSISSVLITQLKAPSIGMQLATELGTIALLANIFREMTALVGAPFIRKYFGRLAPISAAGIGSADILLASISRYSGKDAIPLAILHGILINISVPFFVSLFCSL